MCRTSILLLALATFASQLAAQSSPTGNEITIQLSSAKPSVDTGLDLHSGRVGRFDRSPSWPEFYAHPDWLRTRTED
jgi:phosphate-selective porin